MSAAVTALKVVGALTASAAVLGVGVVAYRKLSGAGDGNQKLQGAAGTSPGPSLGPQRVPEKPPGIGDRLKAGFKGFIQGHALAAPAAGAGAAVGGAVGSLATPVGGLAGGAFLGLAAGLGGATVGAFGGAAAGLLTGKNMFK